MLLINAIARWVSLFLAFLLRSRLIRASAVFRNLIFYGFDWLGNVVYYIECLIAVSAGKVASLDGVECGVDRNLVWFATVGADEHSDILPTQKDRAATVSLLRGCSRGRMRLRRL